MSIVRSIISSVAEGAVRLLSGSGRPGEIFSMVPFWQHYGFVSRPKAGARGLVVTMGGIVVCIASDDPDKRPLVAEGESGLYGEAGVTLLLKADGTLEVKGATAIDLGGSLASLQKLVDVRVLQYITSHAHSGVQTGGGTSGPSTTDFSALEASVATQIVRAE